MKPTQPEGPKRAEQIAAEAWKRDPPAKRALKLTPLLLLVGFIGGLSGAFVTLYLVRSTASEAARPGSTGEAVTETEDQPPEAPQQPRRHDHFRDFKPGAEPAAQGADPVPTLAPIGEADDDEAPSSSGSPAGRASADGNGELRQDSEIFVGSGRPGFIVAFLEGPATLVKAGYRPRALRPNEQVSEGDTVETGNATKLELRLPDNSIIRLASMTRLWVKSAAVMSDGQKFVNVLLLHGRAWVKVNGLMGSGSRFEVETPNVVVGLRGTVFQVDARQDKSAVVRVYAGAVAVTFRRGADHGPIRMAQWDKIVGRLMQLSVSADGTPSEVTGLTNDEDADEWVRWNEQRDQQ